MRLRWVGDKGVENPAPRVLVRQVTKDHPGEPPEFKSTTALAEIANGKSYWALSHGVFVSPRCQADNFCVRVYLRQNDK
jgi:hypothetical protein